MSVESPRIGRVPVEFTVANHQDATLAGLGLLDPDSVRRARLRGIRKPGVMRPVLPRSVVEWLGLEIEDQGPFHRPIAKGVSIELFGRDGVYTAFVGPDAAPAILGTIVLEDLDLIVDLDLDAVRPRDPERMFAEI
jgi:hypothetical protein